MITAGTGILVNGFTVFLLARNKEEDLNIKSAYLHMLSDTLVSCGVVFSGGIIMLSNWTWIDPVIGILIAGIIIWSSWSVFVESVILILDGVPKTIKLEHLKNEISALENISDIHNLHIWAVSTTENAMTAHIKLHDIAMQKQTKTALEALLKHHNIGYSTIEFE